MTQEDPSSNNNRSLTPVDHNEPNFGRKCFTQPKFEETYRRLQEPTNITLKQRSAALSKLAGRKLKEVFCGKEASVMNLGQENYENKEEDFLKPNSSSKKCGRMKYGLFCSFFLRFFPFINIMKNYDIKKWLFKDLIAGFTIGIMHVPQGMAYAMLATLPPVYGLYSSLFASFFYFFFGTSRHLTMGAIAIISLLTGSALDRAVAAWMLQSEGGDNSTLSGDRNGSETLEVNYRVLVAAALALAVGLTQFLMGVCRLGVVTRFLSDPMVTGFTVGSSLHVVFSQLTTVLGLSIEKRTGIFNIPLKIYDICIHLPETNFVTLGFALVCMVILYVFTLWINPPIMKRFKVPIPIELLVVLFSAVVSYQLDMETKYGLKVIGYIPSGFPVPQLPHLDLVGLLIGDIFVIALIAFSVCYSLANFYSRQVGYEVDANQEMIAYGLTNVLSSFFHAYPLSGSLSRSALQVALGGMTQVVGLVAATLVLFVILFGGQLLYTVPNCCLSAIILVALRGMFMQVTQLPGLWRYSIWDFGSCVITFFCTAFLDVIYGLLVGIGFSALCVLIRAQLQKAVLLGRVEGSEVYKPIDIYTNCETDSKVKIVRYESDIFYAATDNFINSVIAAVGFDPRPIKNQKIKLDKALAEIQVKLDKKSAEYVEIYDLGRDKPDPIGETVSFSTDDEIFNDIKKEGDKPGCCCCCCSISKCPVKMRVTLTHVLQSKQLSLREQLVNLLHSVPITHIILDCSAWNFIDIVGIDALKTLLRDYNSVGVCVYLAAASKSIQDDFRKSTFYEDFDPSILFISVYDAMMWVLNVERKVDVFDQPAVAGVLPAASPLPEENSTGKRDDKKD